MYISNSKYHNYTDFDSNKHRHLIRPIFYNLFSMNLKCSSRIWIDRFLVF